MWRDRSRPQPSEALSDLANCGIYMFRKEIFDYFPAPGTSKAAKPGWRAGPASPACEVRLAPANAAERNKQNAHYQCNNIGSDFESGERRWREV